MLSIALVSLFITGCATKPIKDFYSADDIKKALMSRGKTDLMIYFDLGSAKISEQSGGQLTEVGIAVTSIPLPRYQVKIVGHTDSTGEDGRNMVLSERRAQAVSTTLQTRFNVEKKYLETEGRGHNDPYVTPEKNKLDRKYNRRVSLELIKKSEASAFQKFKGEWL